MFIYNDSIYCKDVLFFFQCIYYAIRPFTVNELQRFTFKDLHASVRYPVLYINASLLFCVFSGMWICLCEQGSIQQQTGGDPPESLCLTGGFAPTVSPVYTKTLTQTALYASLPALCLFLAFFHAVREL